MVSKRVRKQKVQQQSVFIIQVGKRLICRGPVSGTLEEVSKKELITKRYYTRLYNTEKVKISTRHLQPYEELE